MNPELEANVNEALDWLQKTGGAVQDFAVEQAPLYCREVVAWEFWSGAVFGGIGLVLMAIGLVALMKFIMWMKEDECEPNGRTVPAFFVTTGCLAVGVAMASSNIPKAVKATVAPRMVIVEHLRNLPKP